MSIPSPVAAGASWRRSVSVDRGENADRAYLASGRYVTPRAEDIAPGFQAGGEAAVANDSAASALSSVASEPKRLADGPRKASRLQLDKSDSSPREAGQKSPAELLVEAAMFGNVPVVLEMLDSGANVDSSDASGYTSLHWAVVNRHGEVLRTLLDRGADVNFQDLSGYSPLHHAVRRGIAEYVGLLLEKGADPNLKTSSGQSAIRMCTSKQILQQLQRAKKSQNTARRSSQLPGDRALLRELESVEEGEHEVEQKEAELQLAEREHKRNTDELREQRKRLQRLDSELRGREDEFRRREALLLDLDMRSGLEKDRMSEESILAAVLPRMVFDDLTVLGQLGSGGFATVLRAQWLGDQVAVKKLLFDAGNAAEVVDSFYKETMLLSKMRHPNVVLLMGASCVEPDLAIVTELMARGDLFMHIHDRDSPIADWELRLQISADIARGMNYLHSLEPPMIHRDLKSCNILIDDRWRAKVSDFGTTRTRNKTMVQTVKQVGTPAWMAPECLRGDSFDEKSDVYSFGVIIWELVRRAVPWEGMEPLQVIGAVGFRGDRLTLPDPPPAGCPKWYVDLGRACFGEAEQRPKFREVLATFRNNQVL